MQDQVPVRNSRVSPAAARAIRAATAALFVAVGVALSPFSIPVFGAKLFPVQSLLNVLGAVFLGPVYTILAALIVSLIRNALGLGTPLAYLGSMVGALLASLAYRSALAGARFDEVRSKLPPRVPVALIAAAVGEIIGTGILAAFADGAIVAPVLLHRAVAFTIYVIPFLLASIAGAVAACVAVIALWSAGVRPRLPRKAGARE